jgi:hypothetical protein
MSAASDAAVVWEQAWALVPVLVRWDSFSKAHTHLKERWAGWESPLVGVVAVSAAVEV